MFLGGYVIKRFNMHVKEILKLIVATNVIVLFLCLSFVMRCPTGSLAGFSQDRASSEQLRQPCNSNCNCSFHNYAPVCGEDKFSYFNPCAAGCQQVIDVPVKVRSLHYYLLVLQEQIHCAFMLSEVHAVHVCNREDVRRKMASDGREV